MAKFIIKRKPVVEMITEMSCEACDCSIKMNITPEEQERGLYPNYCDTCESIKEALENEEPVPADVKEWVVTYIREHLD